MDPRKQVTVTRGPWNYGGTSGSDGHFIEPFRIREGFPVKCADGCGQLQCTFRVQRGQLYGHELKGTFDERRAESTRLGLLYGYTQYYGRNTGKKFVMSRAARKRGYKTDDRSYNYRALSLGAKDKVIA